MILNNIHIGTNRNGYIGGFGNGIVTVNGVPASRDIILFHADTLAIVYRTTSLKSGRYMFIGIDADIKYMMIVRPLPTDSETNPNPYGWDHIPPATDLTVKEQMETWQSWQDAI